MRVGVDARVLVAGQSTGIGRYLRNLLAAAFSLDGCLDWFLYSTGRLSPRQFAREFAAERCTVRGPRLPTSLSAERFNLLWLDLYLPWRVRCDRLDLFHGPAFVLPSSRRVPRIVTVHDLSPVLHPEWYDGIISRAIISRLCKAIAEADRIIADSFKTQDDICRRFRVDSERCRVIYLGVEERFWSALGRHELDSTRQRFGLDRPFILHVGGVHPRKNIVGLLEAYTELRALTRLPHALLIAGKTTCHEAIVQRRIDELGLRRHVRLLGYVEEELLPSLYRLADVFVFPSLYEGFGLPVLEAMACGTPVVASRAGSLPEIVGDAAVLVDPNDAGDLAAAMRSVLGSEDLRSCLADRGRRRAAEFSWTETARQTLQVYNEVCG